MPDPSEDLALSTAINGEDQERDVFILRTEVRTRCCAAKTDTFMQCRTPALLPSLKKT